MSVTLVESGNLGGTCLNNGCIPTKTLKASADALELALRLSQFGITGQGAPAVDPAAVLARKEKVCATLRGGLEKACASLGVRLLKGRGRLVHAGLVEASTAEGPVSVVGDRVILATGSGALELPGLPVDHTHILTSDDALALDRCPRPSPSWAGASSAANWRSSIRPSGPRSRWWKARTACCPCLPWMRT